MEEDDFRDLFLQLSVLFSEANVFQRWFQESTNEENRERWRFQLSEKLEKAGTCLQNIPDKYVFLLLEQFEGNAQPLQLVQDFFQMCLGKRFIEKLRYSVEQERIPITGPHDGGYDSEFN